MVELRSGRRVDLCNYSKVSTTAHLMVKTAAEPSSAAASTRLTKIDRSLDFEIFEDDPEESRPDLQVSPLDYWETTADDQENNEPYTATQQMPVASRLPVVREELNRGSSNRGVLHQIAQDDACMRPPAAPRSPKRTNNTPGRGARKAESSTTYSKQPPHESQVSAQSQPGIRRVNVMNLR